MWKGSSCLCIFFYFRHTEREPYWYMWGSMKTVCRCMQHMSFQMIIQHIITYFSSKLTWKNTSLELAFGNVSRSPPGDSGESTRDPGRCLAEKNEWNRVNAGVAPCHPGWYQRLQDVVFWGWKAATVIGFWMGFLGCFLVDFLIRRAVKDWDKGPEKRMQYWESSHPQQTRNWKLVKW